MKLGIAIFVFLAALSVVLIHSNSKAQTLDDEMFTVSVQVSGNGSGLIVSSPPGIDCGNEFNDCTASFAKGTPVTLRARTLRGPSEFRGWSVAYGSTIQCPGSRGDCRMILLEDSSVQAQFLAR